MGSPFERGPYEERPENFRTDGLDSTLSIFATKCTGENTSCPRQQQVFLANFAPDDGFGAAPAYNYSRTVTLQLQGIDTHLNERNSDGITVMAFTINSTCANPKRLWQTEMDSINWPNAQQLQMLHRASEPCTDKLLVTPLHSTRDFVNTDEAMAVSINVTLEPYSVVKLVIR